jgi:hypothetical protein
LKHVLGFVQGSVWGRVYIIRFKVWFWVELKFRVEFEVCFGFGSVECPALCWL